MLHNPEELETKVSLTLVIPFLDNEATLPLTVQSLSEACSSILCKDVDILFVDNGSTDGSRAIVDSFCATQINARCVSEPIRGVSSARNAGLASAHGDYIASVDADDEVASDYLSALIPVLKQAPDLVILPFTPKASIKGTQFIDHHRNVLDVILGWWCWQFVFRRALCKGLAFRGQCYEDFGFFPRLLQRSAKIALLHGNLYHYRDNPNSLTRRSAIWRLAQLEEVGRELLSDGSLTDQHLVRRVTKDHLRGRMQLRAIAGVWPVLPLKDCATLIGLSQGMRLMQVWQILRLSASVLKQRVFRVPDIFRLSGGNECDD